MKVIDLSDIEHDFFFGAIVPMKTGVVFRNQVGGTACAHPLVEGVFIPFPRGFDASVEDPLLDWCSGYEPKRVRKFLCGQELDDVFEPLTVEEAATFMEDGNFKLAEAWVPVRIKAVKYGYECLKDFIGETVVLTCANSD